jgi:hypothetical protein
MTNIELGLDTFGDVTADADGRLVPHARVLRDVLAEAELADQVGVDFSESASTIVPTSPSAPPKFSSAP